MAASRLRSFVYWKRVGWGKSVFPNDCEICDGMGEVDVDGEVLYCSCAIQTWMREVHVGIEMYRSRTAEGKTLDNLDVRGRDSLADAIEHASDWMKHPYGFLVLTGPYGVGKSHILQAINVHFWPIALYITASDFSLNVYGGVKANTLGEFQSTVSLAPILLFDDWGMEYDKPGSLFDSVFTHVVDTRDRDHALYPMAVATNLSAMEIRNEGRVGSRLLARDVSKVVAIVTKDYRLRKEQ